MKAVWRTAIAAWAAATALAGTGALAQTAVTPAPAPAPATNEASDAVGQPQLRDFTLNGTVTRRAEEQPVATPRPATTPQPATRPATRPPAGASTPPGRVAEPVPAPRSPTVTEPTGLGFELPAPAAAPSGAALQPPLASSSSAPAAIPAPEDPSGLQPSPFLWLVLALAGAAAAFYFLRVRPRPQLAAAPAMDDSAITPSPEPAVPAAPLRAPPPAPPPQPAGPVGVVSTRLRPWLDFEFVPERVIVDGERATVEFVLGIRNTGGAKARDISVEAAMLNAGPAQDQQIGLFFRQPADAGERIAEIAPFQSVEVRSAIALRRDQLQPIEIDGRPLLVPMIAINGRYHWGASNSGQTSASFLVGKETSGEKLAPVRLDLAPRVFRGLAAREHSLRVRV